MSDFEVKVSAFFSAILYTIGTLAFPIIVASICVWIWGTTFAFILGLIVTYIFVHEYRDCKRVAIAIKNMLEPQKPEDSEAAEALAELLEALAKRENKDNDKKDD